MPRKPSAYAIGITTFDAKGRFDPGAMREHCQRIVAAGLGFYAGGSSPGEQYAMPIKEVEQLLALCAKEMKGKVPIRSMGVEPRTIQQMLDFVKMAEASGVDATQIYSLDLGHGNKPLEAEMERYYRTVLEKVRLPAVISSHSAMGYVIQPDMMRRLAMDYPKLVGYHISSPDIAYLVRALDVIPERVTVHVGGPMHALTGLAMGASGFLAAEANWAPRLAQSVIDHWAAGRYPKSHEAYHRFMRVFAINTFGSASVRWQKAAMQVLGLAGHYVRDPHVPLTDAQVEQVREALVRLDIPRIEKIKLPAAPKGKSKR